MEKKKAYKVASSSSESVFEFYCQFCNDNGRHLEAEGYCTVCEEYLCTKCITCHQGNRFTFNHQVLDKETMSKDTPPGPDRVRKDITSVCKYHKGELVKYYCKSHEELVCSDCIVDGHQACTDIANIYKASQALFQDTEFKDFIQRLKSLENQVNDISSQSREHIAKSELNYSKAVEAIDKYRDEINSTFDNIVIQLKKQAKSFKMQDVIKIENIETTCRTLLENLKKMLSEFTGLQSDNRVCQAYIRMKETDTEIKDIQQQLFETGDNNTINIYTFKPNTKLIEFPKESDKLGMLSIETYVPIATFIQDIHVKTENDSEKCLTTGSDVLHDGKLIAIEYFNSNIKLVDTNNSMKLISELKVSGRPWDATVISSNKVAVTIPEQNTILTLKVNDSIAHEREIKVNGECRGIEYSKNQLIVSFVYPDKVDIMDLQGNVSLTIDTDQDGNNLFKNPEYVCVGNYGETIYVSEFTRNAGRVTSIKRNGFLNVIFNENGLKGPKKLCRDQRENIYICGEDSNTIHMITADSSKMRVLLTKADGLTRVVHSVSHCRRTDRLFVGMWGGLIKVYQLS